LTGGSESGAKGVLAARAAVIRDAYAGAVTPSKWHKRNKRRTLEVARGELDELVKAGMAVWRQRPASALGGRPTEECALVDPGGDGEVSGYGYRGAPLPGAEQNGSGAVGNAGGEGQTARGRTPKPLTEDPCRPNSREEREPDPGGDALGNRQGGRHAQARTGFAPRYPIPETPSGEPETPDATPQGTSALPETRAGDEIDAGELDPYAAEERAAIQAEASFPLTSGADGDGDLGGGDA